MVPDANDPEQKLIDWLKTGLETLSITLENFRSSVQTDARFLAGTMMEFRKDIEDLNRTIREYHAMPCQMLTDHLKGHETIASRWWELALRVGATIIIATLTAAVIMWKKQG